MSRQSISPIKVIETRETSHGPASSVVHTIVAIDKASNKAWSDRNEQFELSDVESWPRPMDDIFMQPIQPLSTTTIGADGKPFTETLVPTAQQSNHVQQTTKVEQTTQMQPQVQAEQPATTSTTQTSSTDSLADTLIEKVLSKTIKQYGSKQLHRVNLYVEAYVDLESLFNVAEFIDVDKTELIKACIDKQLIDAIHIA